MGRRKKDEIPEELALLYTYFFIMEKAKEGVRDLVLHVAKKNPQKAKKIVDQFCKGVRRNGQEKD
mgnify:CR=1 FL=1